MADQTTIDKILERKRAPIRVIAQVGEEIDKISEQLATKIADYNAAVDAALTAGWRRSELKEMGITRRAGGAGNGRRRGRRRRSNPEPAPEVATPNPMFTG